MRIINRNHLLKFNEVELSHNPAALSVRYRKTVKESRLISGRRVGATILREPESISGKGELYGENALDDFNKLMSLCGVSRPSPLSLPYLGAFMAVLSELTLAAEPRENYIAVNFVFRAVAGEDHPEIRSERYVVAHEGESLWDIAYRYGADINSLIALNPNIRKIHELEDGVKVVLY